MSTLRNKQKHIPWPIFMSMITAPFLYIYMHASMQDKLDKLSPYLAGEHKPLVAFDNIQLSELQSLIGRTLIANEFTTICSTFGDMEKWANATSNQRLNGVRADCGFPKENYLAKVISISGRYVSVDITDASGKTVSGWATFTDLNHVYK